MKGCELADGASAAQVIEACIKEQALEQKRIEAFGRNAGEYMLFRDSVKAIDRRIENVRTSVMNIMLDEASAGKWLATGRRGPEGRS